MAITLSLVFTLLTLASAPLIKGIASELKVKIPFEIVFIAVPLVVLSLYLVWQNQKLWVYAVVLLHGFILIDQKEGIGAQEVMFSISVLVGLPIWFLKETVIHRRKIAQSGFDVFLISFFSVSSITAFLAMLLNNGNPMMFLKEWVILLDLLMYFPVRNALKTKRDVQILIGMVILLALMNGVVNMMNYRQKIMQAAFQWEIMAGRKTANEPVSIALLLIGATVFAHAKTKKLMLASLCFSGLGLLFLTISFSRGPIICGFVAVFLMTLRIKFKNSLKTYLAIVISVVIGALTMYLLFPNIIKNIGIAVSSRLGSVASAASDVSLGSRVAESKTVINDFVARSPVIGYGFGTYYSFYDPLTQETITRTYMHNGYIWSLFKFGVPLAIYFFLLLLYPIIALYNYSAKNDDFKRAVGAAVIGYIVGALIMNNTSSQFTQYAGAMNMMIAWALADYARRDQTV